MLIRLTEITIREPGGNLAITETPILIETRNISLISPRNKAGVQFSSIALSGTAVVINIKESLEQILALLPGAEP